MTQQKLPSEDSLWEKIATLYKQMDRHLYSASALSGMKMSVGSSDGEKLDEVR
jgi:hypothetical protein